MKSKTSKIVYFIVVLLFMLLFDLYFSNSIVNTLKFGTPFGEISHNRVFDLVYVTNTGAAFSILNQYPHLLTVIGFISVIICLYAVIKYANKMSGMMLFWMGMLLAGISGNLYERIVYGYVRDFFDIKLFDFPVFNISDMFISIGVICILFIMAKSYFRIRGKG
ncbi:signal peptidase II [bacterium]|nr:signal peptidase II [bacterium]